jgi:hypothetical protein
MYNSQYKRWHSPNTSGTKAQGGTSKTQQGYYKPEHPEKYVGDINLIIYRSSWELAFCKYCDYSPSIKRWSAEPISVPYYNRVSNLEENQKLGLDPNNPVNWKIKKYNIDFWIEQEVNNKLQKIFVEIKPKDKLKKPIPPDKNAPLKEQKQFVIKAKEYIVNEAKFAAIKAWAEKNNSLFYVFTEDTLKNILTRFSNLHHE